MSVSQTEFASALRAGQAPRPRGLSDGLGRAAGRRFDVYRNNVTVSLIEALEASFPCLRKLVGEENFKVLARAFVEAHPPDSPMMMFYGTQIPGFLAGFSPVQDKGYLPDVARLELAMRQSYHAADASSADPAALQAIAPERLVLALVPSARLIRSDWPVFDVWAYTMRPGAPKPQMAAQDVLVLRPDLDPSPHLLPPGGGAFVAALMSSVPLAAALSAAQAEVPEFDLTAALSVLIAGRAIHTISEDTP